MRGMVVNNTRTENRNVQIGSAMFHSGLYLDMT